MARKQRLDRLIGLLTKAPLSQEQTETPAESLIHKGRDYGPLCKLLRGEDGRKLEKIVEDFPKSIALPRLITTVNRIFNDQLLTRNFLIAVANYCNNCHLDQLLDGANRAVEHQEEVINGCMAVTKQIDKLQQCLKESPKSLKSLFKQPVYPAVVGQHIFADITSGLQTELKSLKQALNHFSKQAKATKRRKSRLLSGERITPQAAETKKELLRNLLDVVEKANGAKIYAHFFARAIEAWRTCTDPSIGFCDVEFKELTTTHKVCTPYTKENLDFIRGIMTKG